MFHLFFVVPWGVIVLRYLLPLTAPLWVKLAVALVLLIVAEQHLISRWVTGSIFSPEIHRPLSMVMNALLGALILLAVFQLLLDLIMLLIMLVRQQRMAAPDMARYIMAVIALGLGILGAQQASRVPPVKDVEIAIPGLAPQFEGYRIVQLTDLHISGLFPESWTRAVVERTNTLGADAILITGDLMDGTLENRRDDVAPLAGLRAPDGVFVSPGNHEYYFGYEQWMQHYVSLGMQRLSNAHALIERDGARLAIAGVNDPAGASRGLPGPDVAAAIDGVPDDVPIILLDHQPKNAREAAREGVALQLSGHTHGGMIIGMDQIVARANEGFVSGRYDVDDMTLYVSNGTALWMGFALRLGKPSELTRITLYRK
ncbi:metallophosphoesterase [Kushneria pakistanensis]|uniref:Metallophosphoesterase n=1 Tax=Kushneria pakistanensis TaxID=1508770 RepID=A0ABQ3FHE7_9GAMM|nr:metallophosphoesterase [Kushneria pakistanensis]GHC24529.1 metallophosphoesterase [Kushneria pakistanensis]